MGCGHRPRHTGYNAVLSLSACGYTGDGLRAWKQSGSGPKTYSLYDGADPVAELDASGSLQAVNTFGANGLLSRRTASTNASVFYTFDERGNVAQRLSSSGSVLSTDLYDAYGARTSTAALSDPWGFGGQWGYQSDGETGLVLCTNRYYDPQSGRFLTRDPMGYDGGINLYGYTTNDPVSEIDPTGFGGQAPSKYGKKPVHHKFPPAPPVKIGPPVIAYDDCNNPVYRRFLQTHPNVHNEWEFDEALDKWYSQCKNLGAVETGLAAVATICLAGKSNLGKLGGSMGAMGLGYAWNNDCDKIKFRLKEIAHKCLPK